MFTRIRAFPLWAQVLTCAATVLVVAWCCQLAHALIGYQVVALVLLFAVSVLAALFRTLPVLVAAGLSALVWNFFFIPPVHTFHIDRAEDLLMFLAYFVIASVNAVLTWKVRQAEARARDKEEKDKAIVLYNTLLNSLSHELRTPITTILGAVDALQEDQGALSAHQRTELLDAAHDAGLRLDRQVANLLNMGRLESGMLRPKADWCDVNELIGDVLHGLEQGPAHAVHFTADAALPLFKLDGGLLRQVVYDLVHNALRHTPAGTRVQVAATVANGCCRIVVADEGPGFPEAERARAFEKFYRLPGTRTGGSGLGLSIVKGFVEAMGGMVKLEANTPHGARFIITLPAETSFLSNLKHE